MLVCSECFSDIELQSEIANSDKIDQCDILHKDAHVMDFEEFGDFFGELLDLFERSNSSTKTVVNIIQEEWNIFTSDAIAVQLLTFIMDKHQCGYTVNDYVTFNKKITDSVARWDELKERVKYQSRFFTDLGSLNGADFLEAGKDGLHEGEILYRARIASDGQKYSVNEMGCPPKEMATAGRANPIGIPYLYLSREPKTTYYEVRAIYLDNLSVGKFKIKKDLKLVDFTYKINIYANYTEGTLKDVVIKKKIIDAISRDLSKPLLRFDSELEYVPTQMICEYCKTMGAHGISFESSLHQGGKNYVLFNPSDAECIDVETHTITKIDIIGDH